MRVYGKISLARGISKRRVLLLPRLLMSHLSCILLFSFFFSPFVYKLKSGIIHYSCYIKSLQLSLMHFCRFSQGHQTIAVGANARAEAAETSLAKPVSWIARLLRHLQSVTLVK